jgi:hypothetical protein
LTNSSPPTPVAAAACSPAAAVYCVRWVGWLILPWRAQVRVWVLAAALRAGTVALVRGPTPKPALPRCGNQHQYGSTAPGRESRGCDARQCCRACRWDARRSFAAAAGEYRHRRTDRHRRTARNNTIQRCRSSAKRAILPLQARQQGYETHGAERLTFDPRLTLGITI